MKRPVLTYDDIKSTVPVQHGWQPTKTINFNESLISLLGYYNKLSETCGGMPRLSAFNLRTLKSDIKNMILVKSLGDLRPERPYNYQIVGIGLRDLLEGEESNNPEALATKKAIRQSIEKSLKVVEKKKKPYAFEGLIDEQMKQTSFEFIVSQMQVLLLPFSSDCKNVNYILAVVK